MSGAARQGRAADLSAYRAALEAVAEAVVIADAAGYIEFANEIARGRLKIVPGERVGLPETDPLTWLSWIPNRRIRTIGDRDGIRRVIIVVPLDRTPDEQSDVRLAGSSAQTRSLSQAIATAGQTNEPVLVSGEPGTGKETVARAVHESARYSGASFEPLASRTLSIAALDRRLQGHGAGGLVGTLFLDDVDGLRRSVQRRLAQAFAADEVHVRMIAATQADIESLVESGVFDRELFFRLNAIPIHVSPLRDRPIDIGPLADAVIRRCNAESSRKRVNGVLPDAADALAAYSFPGNARELEMVVERAWARCRGKVIRLDHLPDLLTKPSKRTRKSSTERLDPDSLDGLEREFMLRVLTDNDWRLGAVAAELAVSRTTLWRKLSRLKIANPRRKRG